MDVLKLLQAHAATVILSLLLLAAVVLAIVKIVKDKKNGKCPCGGQCSGCAMSGQCHSQANPDK